jgi:hypothetical protein
MRSTNPLVLFPSSGLMTQGTIFSCAVAEDYSSSTTHGLVITARCDASNDKVRVFNYLPIVSLDDWLRRDGRIIVSQRLMKETVSKMKSALSEAGYSASILETETPTSILDALFPPGGHAQKARARFEDLCARYETAAAGTSGDAPNGICLQVAKIAPKLKDSMISELVHQQLAGHYFLSQIEPNGNDAGYVVLLREIQTLPRSVAHAVSNSLERARFDEMCAADPRLSGRLRIGLQDLAMPVGVLRSPNVEHLMQSFSLLFSRIGIVNPDPEYIDALWLRQPSVAETD